MLHSRGAALLVAAVTLTQTTPETFDLAIRDARIIHGDGRVTERGTVFVAAGRIRLISTSPSNERARRTIDASGQTLIPGLIDAHVHIERWALGLFLRYGVTTVRDLHNDPAVSLPLAREDTVVGHPRVVAAGALLDGPNSFWPNAVSVDDVAEARDAVRSQVADGAAVIKVYTRVPPSIVAVTVREARARGVPVAAHLGRTSAVEAADAGVASIEHLTGIPEAASEAGPQLRQAHDDFFRGWTAFELEWPKLTEAALERVARRLKDRDVVLVPTLALHDAFSRLTDAELLGNPALDDVPGEVVKAWDPEELMRRTGWTTETLAAFRRTLPVLQRFVHSYVRLGGIVGAGTDTPQQYIVPGDSLHRELELYVAGGLSPAEALATATTSAARLLGLGDRLGQVTEGYEADLVLLAGNPLDDITATRRITHVFRGGVEATR